jgi:transposase
MLERRDRLQDELFVAGSLRDLIPSDHVLARVDKVLDLAWLREAVSDCYDLDRGRPGIDPEAAVRLMLSGLLLGIVQDRRLLREAQVNLAIRWFCGYALHERLPDHSSLTRIRRRWGPARFLAIFERTVEQCVAAGLVTGDLVHLDATLIRADVSWESLVKVHVAAVAEANADCEDEDDAPSGSSKGGTAKGDKSKGAKVKKVSRTDPEARMATSHRGQRLEPSYKQLTGVDGAAGVVVDVDVVSGETHEGGALPEQLERIEARTGLETVTATADKAYATADNYAVLEARGTTAVIPPQRLRRAAVPLARFKYDAKHDRVRCPRGRKLRRAGRYAKGRFHRARPADCQACPLKARCLSPTMRARSVQIPDGYAALLRARRRHRRRLPEDRAAAASHRARVEGVHGEAKAQHGLGRAVRRGLWNVAVQAYLTAAAINLKRLARALLRLFVCYSSPGALSRRLQALLERLLHTCARVIPRPAVPAAVLR